MAKEIRTNDDRETLETLEEGQKDTGYGLAPTDEGNDGVAAPGESCKASNGHAGDGTGAVGTGTTDAGTRPCVLSELPRWWKQANADMQYGANEYKDEEPGQKCAKDCPLGGCVFYA